MKRKKQNNADGPLVRSVTAAPLIARRGPARLHSPLRRWCRRHAPDAPTHASSLNLPFFLCPLTASGRARTTFCLLQNRQKTETNVVTIRLSNSVLFRLTSSSHVIHFITKSSDKDLTFIHMANFFMYHSNKYYIFFVNTYKFNFVQFTHTSVNTQYNSWKHSISLIPHCCTLVFIQLPSELSARLCIAAMKRPMFTACNNFLLFGFFS